MGSPDATLRYADHEDAVIDVHLPTGATDKLVVFLHGGFWKQTYDRRHTRELARALADDGWVVAAPEYRRVGPGVGGGGGFPTTCNDVLLAMRELPKLLEGIGVTPRRSVLAGHSAGGHLALWLASELPQDRVVPLAPVADLYAAANLGLGSNAVQAFMGGTFEDVDYEPAEPMARLSQHLNPDIVVLHGVEDDTVPISQSRNLKRALPWVDVRELEGVGHFEFLEPSGPVYEAFSAALA